MRKPSGNWQPIETAPKDGTKIKLARLVRKQKSPKAYNAIASWWDLQRGYWVGDFGDGVCGRAEWRNHVMPSLPTHWMPLDAASRSDQVRNSGIKESHGTQASKNKTITQGGE